MSAFLAGVSVFGAFGIGFVVGSRWMRGIMAEAFAENLRRRGVTADEWIARDHGKP